MPTDAVLPGPAIARAPARGLHGSRVLVEVWREALHGLVRNRFRAGLPCSASRGASSRWSCCWRTGTASAMPWRPGSPTRSADGVVISWPGQTSMQAGGERAGRPVRVTVADALQIAELPLVKAVSPEFVEEQSVTYGTKQASYLVRAVAPVVRPYAHGDSAPRRPLPRRRGRAAAPARGLHRHRGGPEAVRREQRRRPDDPHPRPVLRGDRRDEGEGAALELLPARHAEHLHPLHGREPDLVPAGTRTWSSGRPWTRRRATRPSGRSRSCSASWPTSTRTTSARCGTVRLGEVGGSDPRAS